jgi:hypothetical protein
MTEKPPKPPFIPRPSSSGEHPEVKAYRAKLDSIRENQLPELEALNERLARLTDPGPTDPRREEDGEIPVDVVEPPPSAAP